MAATSEYFARVAERVNLPLLQSKTVVLVGIGTVGSSMARELANSGVGSLFLVDGDVLEISNLSRHALTMQYVGKNKALAMAEYLRLNVPGLQVGGMSSDVDNSLSDEALDQSLAAADLIIAATDDRRAQRRIAQRALALDIPVVLPGLYAEGGSEVFVQQSVRRPCFMCWDGWRSERDRLRAVAGLNADTLALVQLAVPLSLGILDRDCEYASLLNMSPGAVGPPQLFVQNRFALAMHPVRRRPNCPSCLAGPASGLSSAPVGPERPNGRMTPAPPLARSVTAAFLSDPLRSDLAIVLALMFLAPLLLLHFYSLGLSGLEHYFNSLTGLGTLVSMIAALVLFGGSLIFGPMAAFQNIGERDVLGRAAGYAGAFAFGFFYVVQLTSLVMWGHIVG